MVGFISRLPAIEVNKNECEEIMKVVVNDLEYAMLGFVVELFRSHTRRSK